MPTSGLSKWMCARSVHRWTIICYLFREIVDMKASCLLHTNLSSPSHGIHEILGCSYTQKRTLLKSPRLQFCDQAGTLHLLTPSIFIRPQCRTSRYCSSIFRLLLSLDGVELWWLLKGGPWLGSFVNIKINQFHIRPSGWSTLDSLF